MEKKMENKMEPRNMHRDYEGGIIVRDLSMKGLRKSGFINQGSTL